MTQQIINCLRRASDIVDEEIEKRNFYSTGCESLDKLLVGGLRTGEITQIYGNSGCGKTQLIHQIALQSALGGRDVFIIDCDNTFTPERLVQMLEKHANQNETEKENILKKIYVEQIFYMKELIKSLSILRQEMSSTESSSLRVSLLAIDSLNTPMVGDLIEVEDIENCEKKERFALFTSLLRELKELIVEQPHLAIVITTIDDHWFGPIWTNACSTCLEIYADEFSENRIVRCKRSLRIPAGTNEIDLIINDHGFKER